MNNPSNSVIGDSAGLARSSIEITPSPQAIATLRAQVICGAIEEVGNYASINDGQPPVDAIAVGHYLNVEPQFAELALDNAISGNLTAPVAAAARPTAANIITDFTRRGIIQGKLGVPFFLPDPRDNKRIVAIAGMGSVGCFG